MPSHWEFGFIIWVWGRGISNIQSVAETSSQHKCSAIMKSDFSGLYYQCIWLSRALVLVPLMQIFLGLIVYNREPDARLLSTNNNVTIWYLLYQIFNLHYLIQYHNNPAGLVPHTFNRLKLWRVTCYRPKARTRGLQNPLCKLEICLKTVKQNYLNKIWTAINNSSLFSRISTWSLQFRADQHLNHSSTWAISGTLRQHYHI